MPMKERARGGLPNCRFYNDFELILQSTIHPKMQSTNLQDFGQKYMQSTKIFQPNLKSMDILASPPHDNIIKIQEWHTVTLMLKGWEGLLQQPNCAERFSCLRT